MDHRTHLLDDGRKLKVLGDDILVIPDELPEQSVSGLVYPSGAMAHVNNTGTIVAYGMHTPKKKGKGKPVSLPGLEVGLKCAFVRFIADQSDNVHLREKYEGVVRLKKTDVLFVYTADEQERVLA